MAGEVLPTEFREYTVRLYMVEDNTGRGQMNETGWVADITYDKVTVKKFTRCWSQRRARNKSRRWVKKRVMTSTKVAIIEVLEGS